MLTLGDVDVVHSRVPCDTRGSWNPHVPVPEEEVKQTSDSRHRVGFMYCKDKNVNACAFFPEKR